MKRSLVGTLVFALLAGGFGAGMSVSGAPAAQAEQNAPGAMGASNPFYVYLQAGEMLYVDGGGQWNGVFDHTGAAVPGNGNHMYGPATADGVWQVDIGNVNNPNLGESANWIVTAQDADGNDIPGRVWSTLYRAVQQTSAPGQTLDFWVVNDSGYIYELTDHRYQGVNSRIRADAIGNETEPGSCVPSYLSKEASETGGIDGWTRIPECGGAYRVFFAEPAADLPASAQSADGEMTVLPAPVTEADLAIEDLAYSAESPETTAGTFSWSLNSRFTGGYWLEIDADGDGEFTGDADRRIQQYADGSGTYSSEFDGLDATGEAMDPCIVHDARIRLDKVGEVHVVQDDVELRGGIELNRLNGPGAPDDTIYWDDTQLANNRANTTPVTDGTDGIASTGGVHGWAWDGNSWGNNRGIDDWAYAPIDVQSNAVSLGGGCESLSLEKTSDATENTRVGDTVTYTVTATNDGTADYTAENPAVVLDDMTSVLDDGDYNDDATASQGGDLAFESPRLSWSGALPAGESVELTYTVTAKTGGDGALRNVAWVPSDPENAEPPACEAPEDGVDPVTGEPCAETAFDLPRLTVQKSADRTDLPAVGEPVEYTVEVTNEGPGTYTEEAPAAMSDDLSDVLDSATFNDDAAASTGDVAYEDETLTWTGALAPGETATITYTATYTGEGDQNLRNVACVPESETLPGAPSCDLVSLPGSGLTQWKSVDSSDTPAVAGSDLTYTLFFNNDGEAAATVDAIDDLTHVTDDGDVTVEPAAADGLTTERDGNRISITGTVPAGETASVTYEVTVKPDGERGDDQSVNFLLDPDEEVPSDPVCDPADEQFPDCTSTPIAALDVRKSVDASATPVEAGTVLSYAIEVENTGEATAPVEWEDVLTDVIDDAEVTSPPVSDESSVTVSEIEDGRFTIGGEIAPDTTATISYEATVNDVADRGNHRADNYVMAQGAPLPESCDDESDQCTSTPISGVQVEKTADPETGSNVTAGQEVNYTLTFSNVGTGAGSVDYLDHIDGVLDDSALTTEPTASDPALEVAAEDGQLRITGELAADQTVTVSYGVTVNADGDRGDNLLQNLLAPAGHPDPECGDAGVSCTEHPIGELSAWKTVDPASGATLMTGEEATYTLHFENTGQAPVSVDHDDVLDRVLDDADITAAPAASTDALTVSEIADARFNVAGEVAAGETATVSYTATVKPDGERGDDRLDNFLVAAGAEAPEGVCAPAEGDRPQCTYNHVSDVTVAKSSDPESGSEIAPGDDVTYTVALTNRSENPDSAPVPVDYTDHMVDVLDDAALTGGPTVSDDTVQAVVNGDTVRITGAVPAGETVTVNYTVQAKAYDEQGDHRLANVVAITDEAPVCAPDSPLCTEHPVTDPDGSGPGGGPGDGPGDDPNDGPGWLPNTGAEMTGAAVLAALLLAGTGYALWRRGRRAALIGREADEDQVL